MEIELLDFLISFEYISTNDTKINLRITTPRGDLVSQYVTQESIDKLTVEFEKAARILKNARNILNTQQKQES